MKNHINILLREGLVNETNDCDCCGYFDLNTIDDFGFDKPLYRLVEKWELIELRYMAPKQYIYTIARGFGGLSYEDTMLAVSQEKVAKYVQAMENGDRFPVGYYKDGESGQEGRHRALAAMALGCKQIPIVRIQNLNYDDVMNFVIKHKDYSMDDFNQMFNYYPFSGITRLGYNSFLRKVENLKNN